MNTTAETKGRAVPRQFFEILERQRKLTLEMFTLLEDEKEALTTLAIDRLIGLSSKKQRKMEMMCSQDGILKEMIDALAPPQEPQSGENRPVELSRLLPFCTEKEAALLKRYRDALSNYRREILIKNLYNQKFTEDTLKYLNGAISLLTGAITNDLRYGNKGKPRNVHREPSMISRAV